DMPYFGAPSGHDSGDGYDYTLHGSHVHIAVTINWGDGTTGTGTLGSGTTDPLSAYLETLNPGVFLRYQPFGQHTYATAGTYRIEATITIQYEGEASYVGDILDSTANVAEAAPSASFAAPAPSPPAAASVANAADG